MFKKTLARFDSPGSPLRLIPLELCSSRLLAGPVPEQDKYTLQVPNTTLSDSVV
jgi:hypothetical protein